MSLRGFHLIFIAASMLLCAFFGWWAMNMHREQGGGGYMITAVVSFLSAIGLLAYSIYFVKKVKAQ